MPIQIQVPSIILPQVWVLGTEVEIIDDLLEHTSIEFPVEYLQEKQVHIYAQEIALAPAAVPGNLLCWIELSPYPSANTSAAEPSYWPSPLPTTTAYWAAIGGGGGAIAPVVPHIEVSGLAGAPGTLIHTILLSWTIHSPWARLVIQTSIAAALPAAYWVCQCMVSAKSA